MNEATVSGRNRTLLISVAVVVLIAVVATGAYVMGTSHSASGQAAVTLAPKDQTGQDPFTASVQIGQAIAFPANVQAAAVSTTKALPTDPSTGTKRATGTAPGLYGGSGKTKVCDPQKIVEYLDAHPDKAAAWADVLGIAPSAIKTYVGQLTPVVLTADTLVTNHGYRAGHATTLQSVLQAGTAVMVDATGTPRIKCNCGNPLTPPRPLSLDHVAVRGTPWTGYATDTVTTITPGTTATALTLLNIHTGRTYEVPVGSTRRKETSTSTTTIPAPTTAPASTSSGLDGTWTVRVTGPTGCGPGFLDVGATLVIKGSSATLEPPDNQAYTGTMHVDASQVVIDVKGQQANYDEITLTGTASGNTISGQSKDSGVLAPSQGSNGWACPNTFLATRGSTATSTPTTALSGVAGLPAGLKCKDLVARGLSYDDAYEYWNLQGHPPLMDADHNGIPCETVYPASVVAAYLSAHHLTGPPPTTPAPGPTIASSGPCTVAAIQQALVAAGSTSKALGPPICDGPWAASSVLFQPSGDEGTSFWHWNGSAWVHGDCNAPGVPAKVHLYGCEVS